MSIASGVQGFFDINAEKTTMRTELPIGLLAGATIFTIVWLSRNKLIPKDRAQKTAMIIFSSMVALVIPALVGISSVVKGKSWVSNKAITVLPYASRLVLILGLLTLAIQGVVFVVKRYTNNDQDSP